jgi:hypothetical protein
MRSENETKASLAFTLNGPTRVLVMARDRMCVLESSCVLMEVKFRTNLEVRLDRRLACFSLIVRLFQIDFQVIVRFSTGVLSSSTQEWL